MDLAKQAQLELAFESGGCRAAGGKQQAADESHVLVLRRLGKGDGGKTGCGWGFGGFGQC